MMCIGIARGIPTWGRHHLSHKHEINTRSSAEAELIEVDDALQNILNSLNFIMPQGYDVDHALLYQYNKSVILFEIDDRESSGKRTIQLDIF